MMLIFSNLIDDPGVNTATVQIQNPNINVMEAANAMVEVCTELDNLQAGVTLGCEVSATVAVQDGSISST